MEEEGRRSFAPLPIDEFLDQLASAAPVPGGGSASAIAASLGAALVTMVARLSLGREKYAPYDATLARAEADGQRLRTRLIALADADAAAYAAFAEALKLPRQTEAETSARAAVIRSAARVAAETPLACVQACRDLAVAVESLAGRSNVNAASDVLVAALLAEAAAHGAAENVRINLPAIRDDAFADTLLRRLDGLLHEIEELAAETRGVVLSGQQRDPEPE